MIRRTGSGKWIVIRIKSVIRSSQKVRRISDSLGLKKVNSARLFDASDLDYFRVLKLNNIVTYGPISRAAFSGMFEACLNPVSGKILAMHPQFAGTLAELGSEYYDDVSLFARTGVTNSFSLHPARKGLRSKLKRFSSGGSIGLRPSMDEFVGRMLPAHNV